MVLIIAEKPELGVAIGKALQNSAPGPAKTVCGKLHGEDATVIWGYGHMLELCDPEDYDKCYATWRMEDLPLFFPSWKLKPIKKSESRLRQIAQCVKGADSIIHAGDIDEEGQLLIDEILDYCKYRGPVYRLDTNDTSRKKLVRALDNLVPNDEGRIARGLSAKGRSICDKLFGYNLTRYYTLLNQKAGQRGLLLAVGRVKMPTLGLVVQRDNLIESHKKALYYTLTADLALAGKTVPVKFELSKDDPHLTDGLLLDRALANSIARQIDGMEVSPVAVSKAVEPSAPPLPFNINTLYTYCGKKWGMKPTKVLEITQTLRDKHSAITYNRSDCQYLSMEVYGEAPDTLPTVCANLGVDPGQFDLGIKSRCFNDAYLTAHMGIIPTQTSVLQSALTKDEWAVYEAIAKFYLIQFMPPEKREVTHLSAPGPQNGHFMASASKVLDPGYTAFLGGDGDAQTEDDDAIEKDDMPTAQALLQIPEGTYSAKASNSKVDEKETKPPARYTSTTLVNDMASIAKYVENKAVRDLLLKKDQGKKGEHGSIGTPATRNVVVDDLIKVGYLREEKKGKQTYLISTELGRAFYNMLPDSVRKVDVSTKWWLEQQEICAGNMTPEQMAQDVLKTVSAIISSGQGAIDLPADVAAGGASVGACPRCGGEVVERKMGYCCSSGGGCSFIIWKHDRFFESKGKKMTAALATALLRDRKVKLVGCKSAKGKKYDCIVTVDYSGERAQYTSELCAKSGSRSRPSANPKSSPPTSPPPPTQSATDFW